MFCPKCGKELNDGTIFCSKCGSRIQPRDESINYSSYEPAKTTANAGAIGAATNNSAPVKKEKGNVPIIIGIILVALFALSFILYFLWSNRIIEYPDFLPISVTTAAYEPRGGGEDEGETDEFGDPIESNDDDDDEDVDDGNEVEDEGKEEKEKPERTDDEDRGGGEKKKKE